MQSLVVETAEGPVAIVSDLALTFHNINPAASTILNGNGNEVTVTPQDCEFILPGYHLSVFDFFRYASMEEIQLRVGKEGTLLSGHWAEIFGNGYLEYGAESRSRRELGSVEVRSPFSTIRINVH